MKYSTVIELIGYLGSALVLASFLLTSVVKLRIVNTIGSVICVVYSFIIHSYPTVVMNLCLIAINVFFLFKMGRAEKVYDLALVKSNDSYLSFLLKKYGSDISESFPGAEADYCKADRAYIISHDGKPVGITLGNNEGANLDLILDYTIPQYRDFSVGKFLFTKLAEEGYSTVSYSGPDQNHTAYLNATGFIKNGTKYIKAL